MPPNEIDRVSAVQLSQCTITHAAYLTCAGCVACTGAIEDPLIGRATACCFAYFSTH